jgi:hypothetical protein
MSKANCANVDDASRSSALKKLSGASGPKGGVRPALLAYASLCLWVVGLPEVAGSDPTTIISDKAFCTGESGSGFGLFGLQTQRSRLLPDYP